MAYDSLDDTVEHIRQVRERITQIQLNLTRRAMLHDHSKVLPPEREGFDKFTPMLAKVKYGSEGYERAREAMRPTLEHHYEHNSHHPEYYENGWRGMSLLDVVEMLCDWKAATLRSPDGDLGRSIEINAKRFGFEGWFTDMLRTTAVELGWL